MKYKIFLPILMAIILAFKSDKKAYQLYSKGGKSTDYEKLLKSSLDADVVLFGELHNNPICHWLQLELSKDLEASKKQNLVLGAEMFEADNQMLLDEYLSGLIKEKQLKEEGKMWNNYATDYKPLLEFAKQKNLHFVATNVPRRYANLVARESLEKLSTLSAKQKEYIAPLPIKVDMELPGYKMFLEMNMGHGTEMTPQKMAEAQAVKDATMAHFILKNWQKGKTFLHFNGTYHSNNFEGIVWYLKQQNPQLKIVTIASVEVSDVEKIEEEDKNSADFILAIPESMTKTY